MTLYELYQAINKELASGMVGLVPGILNEGGIADFYLGITQSQSLQVDAPVLDPASADPSISSFVLTGTTLSFGTADGKPLNASITFTEDVGAIFSVGDFRTVIQWNLSGIEWFGISNPGFNVNASNGTVQPNGVLGGSASCLPELFLGMQLPIDGDTWVLQGIFDEPVGISNVIQLAGGINLANSVPPPLNTITSIGVSSANLTYNSSNSTLDSFFFIITQNDPNELFTLFPFLPGFPQVGALTFNFVVIDPVHVRKTMFDFSGKVVFPPNDTATDDASPTMTLSGSLPDFKIQGVLDENGALLTVDDILHIILPSQITTGIKGGFKTLTFSADTPNNSYNFSGTFNADWNITVETTLFTIPLVIKELSMSLQREGENNGCSFGGVIQVGEDDAEGTFQLSIMANTPIGSTDWTYRGWLSEGTISLTALLYTFSKGVFTIPAESFNLVINQLNVEISSAGTYNFEVGAVMTLPFDIGDVSGFLGVYSDGVIPAGSGIKSSNAALPTAKFLALPSPLLSEVLTESLTDSALAEPEQKPAYRMMASYHFMNIDWTLTVDMKDNSNYRYFLSLSEYLTGEYIRDDVKKQATITIIFGNVSVGDIVALLLSWAIPGGPRSLSAPWDILNSIPLNNLEIVITIPDDKAKRDTITVKYPADLSFGFFTLSYINFTYQPKETDASKYEVIVELDGKFINGEAIPSWDATDPNSAPTQPGTGNKYLDIRLLALGQHVTVAGYESFTSVEDAINAMRSLEPPKDDSTIPVSANPSKGQPEFDPKSNWLVGMNFGVLKFGGDTNTSQSTGKELAAPEPSKAGYLLDLSIIFNDPNLYALRFALDGPVAKVLAGLSFEIMYKKVSDSIGMYQAKLTLPNSVRQLQFGVCGITIPNFGVQVFTNGDFLVDIGFPYNNDFTVSFSVQIQAGPLPLIGSGGVYFGKLSSATTSIVPASDCGTFNPVITLGLGIQVGLGKDINIGIMQAGFSITVFGIIEGVYAAFNPFDTAQEASDFFMVKGTIGVIGRLYGTVSFAIISADFEVVVKVYVQASYQSYGSMPIAIVASVEIRLTVKINLGFFSIKIHLSFSATVKETLVIGTDNSANAPWKLCSSGNAALIAGRKNLHVLRTAYLPQSRKRLVMTTLAHTAEEDKPPLTIYYGPAQTVANATTSGALADQTSKIDNLFYIDTGNDSFDNLCYELFNWLVTSYHPETVTRENISDTVITYTDLLDIYHELTDENVLTPLSVAQIDSFLNDHVAVTITPADPTSPSEITAAVFPVPPEVTITVPGGKTRTLSTFTTCDDTYIETMNAFFKDLQIQVENDLMGEGTAARKMSINEDQSFTLSAAGLVFQDFFVMMSSQLIQYGLDAMTQYKYQLNDINANSLAGIVTWSNGMVDPSGVDKNDLTGEVIAEANKDAPLTGGLAISITGLTTQVASSTLLQSVVDQYDSAFTVEALIAINSTTQYLINGGVTITNTTSNATTNATIITASNSTFQSLMAASGWSDAEFAAATASLAGLLTNRTVMPLPVVTYTTATGNTDTFALIANRYATSPSDIANTLANQTISPLFYTTAAAPNYIDLPHMLCLSVSATTTEITNCNSLDQLSGMVSRFLVYGMRLPVGSNTGLTFNDPNDVPCAGGVDCSMYSVTGQQFDLPTLTAGDGVTMVATDNAPAWLKNGIGSGATVTFSTDMIDTMNAVLTEAQTEGVQPGIEFLGIAPMRNEQPVQYDFSQTILWQADGAVSLPYGTPPANEKAPAPYLWPFSSGLLDYLPKTTYGLPNPKLALKIGSVDPSTGQRIVSDASYYGFGSLVNVTIKVISNGSNAYTYELSGADETGVMILERLLAISSKTDTPVQNMTLLYPPNASSGADSGMVSDPQSDVATFITQGNLSTYTNPAGLSFVTLAAAPEAVQPEGLLNTPYNFIKMLWECSITRSGGFYLYYENKEKQAGFPDLIFNENGEATLGLLITYANPGTNTGTTIQPDTLYDYMNVVITGQNINPSSESLFGEAESLPVDVSITEDDSLAAIALRLSLLVGETAELLNALPLAPTTTIALNELIYQVGSTGPKGDAIEIAAYYGTTLTDLEAANAGRGIDFSMAIPVWTALRIPQVSYLVSSGKAGDTLATIVAYYGAELPKVASDNQTTKGLFTAISTTVDVLFTNVNTTTPAGCLALELTRPNPGELPPLGSPDYSQTYLQQVYNLLSYRFGGNQLHNDSFPDTNWGIPVGPQVQDDADSVHEKIKPQLDEDYENTWQYAKSVPAYSVLNGPAISQFGSPPPAAGDPYSVLNRIAQIEFVWRDLYGNETITPISDPALYPTGPKNSPPALLGYTDALVPLSGWPSIVPQYLFKTIADVPTLALVLHFDTSLYTADPSDPTKPWQDQAKKDLETYKTIYYQICQPSLAGQGEFAVNFSLQTSLLADAPGHLGSSDVAMLQQAVTDIYLYLQARAEGKEYAPTAGESCTDIITAVAGTDGDWTYWCITEAIASGDLNDNELFELNVAFEILRNYAYVAPAFADDIPVYRSVTTLNPYVAKQTSSSDAADAIPTYALDAFAADFENTFTVDGSHILKLASGYDRYTSAASASGSEKPLWVVRMGLSNTQGIYFGKNGAPVFFAPTPMATSLQSETVGIHPWDSSTGTIDSSKSSSNTYQNIDMDVWMNSFFSTIDNLLSADLISQAFLVDHLAKSTLLPDILQAKEDLATVYATSRTAPVLADQHESNPASAAERLRQQMLINLADAYDVTTIVSYPMEVTATFTGADALIPPRMYGTPMISSRSGDTATDDAGNNYSFSTAKVNLDTSPDKSDLTFLFYAKNPGDSAVATFDLDYVATNLEHDIGPVTGIADYQASSWLSFLLPPDITENSDSSPLFKELGVTSIPVPLRAFPSAPSMTTQNQQQNLPADPTLSEVLLWNYSYSYVRSTTMQDTIHTLIQVNIDADNVKMFAVDNSKKLFEVLAQFTTIQKNLDNGFNNYLKNVTLQTPLTDETFIQAKGALETILTLMTNAVNYFPAWVPSGGADITEAGNYYIIQQGSDPTYSDRFLVSVNPDETKILYPDLPLPVMHMTGYTTVLAEEKNSYWFTTSVAGETVYLAPEQGEAMTTRELSVDNLNIFEYQNAWSAAYVKRNEFFGTELADDKFVYTSQLAKFANLLVPLIDYSGSIEIYNPEQQSAPPPPKENLHDTLVRFFTDLYLQADDKNQVVTIEGTYSYALMQGGTKTEQIIVTQPMLLRTFADTATTEAGIETFSASLTKAVTTWFDDQKPNYGPNDKGERNGGFDFDLSIFSTLGTSVHKMPLLRLRNLELPLDDLDSLPASE
ncbi:MAG: hypothetical protein COB30_019685 [Ectothiorhodospiraceae bacterium]|nr:hypothetical protein [Ectothiorhodospiraceae bacterium]